MVSLRRIPVVLDNIRWRLRYWVLDKYYDQLRWFLFVAAMLVALCCLAVALSSMLRDQLEHAEAMRAAIAAGQCEPFHAFSRFGGWTLRWHCPAPPAQAAWPVWVVQLIIMVVSAAISYAMRPKPEAVKPQEGSIPETEDGKSIVRLYGTDWFDDSMILGWKNLGTEPIKSGGSKKWTPGLLPGTTNPIESWLDDKWNVSGLADVDDPLGGGNHYPDEGGGEFIP